MALCESFMQRRCLMLCTGAAETSRESMETFSRKVVQEAATGRDGHGGMDTASFAKCHHIGFIDLPKLGRLTAIEVGDMANWAHQVLSQNPEHSVIFMVAPILAGEGVLHGLRGEQRRVEDKFLSCGMELKSVQIGFETTKLHGNRTFPRTLPAWLVMLDHTLGARMGTLFKVPRNAERDASDANVFAKCDLWNSLMTANTDKEETAQWASGLPTIKSILAGCLGKVTSLRGQACVIHHKTMYDGNLERVVCEMMSENQETFFACRSETSIPAVFKFSRTVVKDKLVQDWKFSRGIMSTVRPKYVEDPDPASLDAGPRAPPMKMCIFDAKSGQLTLPRDVREKWLGDPMRNPDWRVRLQNFDAVFNPAQPSVTPAAEGVNLAQEVKKEDPQPAAASGQDSGMQTMSQEKFKEKFPTTQASVTLPVGSVTAHLVDGKVYIVSTTKIFIEGVSGANPKALFLYAGGSWISDSAKVPQLNTDSV
ncbi:unnamed protein product [Effrenium voratum]|uniref:Uncharacterized protein n=1 Tax=Effrenium voratum TaxID=2562239 RepID=A0AA36JMJ6_9DINO|nr:unnamed protein product [Effrenium voratum]CAJ1431514.1 unnamed protein product [Effrenium voratum]